MYGLSSKHLDHIKEVLSSYPEVKKAIVFGSRAMGTYKNGSDVDIALVGDGLNWDITSSISAKLNEESPMAYTFDLVNYHQIKEKELVHHIDTMGECFYTNVTLSPEAPE